MAVVNDGARIDGGEPTDRTVEDAALAGAVPARPRTLVVLHWLTVLCLLLAAAVILARTQVERADECFERVATESAHA